MNKKLLILIITLVVIVPVAAGCTLRTPGKAKVAAAVPHAVDNVRFNNCVSCHAGDLLGTDGKPYDHVYENFTNKDCTVVDCHARPDGTFSTP